MANYDHFWQQCLDSLASAGLRRRLRTVEAMDGARVRIAGRWLTDFSSNDYLGLARHPFLIERATAWTAAWGAGSTASRLVRGNLALFDGLEAKLAAAKECEAALVMVSGFQANASLLPALLDARVVGADPLVFCDRLNHASMHHGCRAAGVRQIRYDHNDLDHLEGLLKKQEGRPGARFIVTETVFSMDGDQSDVPALAALAARFGAFLYLDDAHATGVLGPEGRGLAVGYGDGVGLIMGTFGKALGGFGAYAAGSRPLRDFLINRCGGIVYATALPPAVLGAIDAALDLVPTLDAERARVQAMAARLRRRLTAAGLSCGASSTQIVPVLLGSEDRALRVARGLEDAGFLGVAIRPPTVPAGTSRTSLRPSTPISRDEDVDRLADRRYPPWPETARRGTP